MGEYEDTLKDIEKTLGIIPGFMKALLPKMCLSMTTHYGSLGESKIPAKYRELMGLSAAANIKCPYCQLMHRGIAQLHGATDEELSEVAYLASLTSRWSAMIHAQNYDYDTFAKETDQIGKHLAKTLKK